MFNPFVGSEVDYNSRPVVLILGESQYGKENMPDSTTIIMNSFISGKFNNRYYSNILKAIFGQSVDRKYMQQFIFYNYIQELVGEKAKVRPSKKMWNAAKPRFIEILEKHQPDIVLCFGIAVYNNLPDSDLLSGEAFLMEETKSGSSAWKYVLSNGHEVIVYKLPHLSDSRIFTWNDTNRRFERIFKDFSTLRTRFRSILSMS